MKTQRNLTKSCGLRMCTPFLSVCVVLGLWCCAAHAQTKKEPAKAGVTGNYDGTAKNSQGEVIPVTFELTEKEGSISGMIRSSHGDFTISKGTHQGENVTLEFDTGGPTGTITLKVAEDKMTGTWEAGDDGGSIDVKKVAATDAKEKS